MASTLRSPASRPLANHGVEQIDYEAVLTKWLKSSQYATIDMLLGMLIKSERSVTSTAMMRCIPIVDGFISVGCDSLCLLPIRLEMALVSTLSANPKLVKGGEAAVGLEAHNVAQHILIVLKILRAFIREEHKPASSTGRRFPKTGAIRRRLAPSDWSLLRSVMNKVNLPDVSADSASLPSAPARSRSPLKQPIANACSIPLWVDRRARSSSPASTIPYSDDGFPNFDMMIESCGLDTDDSDYFLIFIFIFLLASARKNN